MALPGIFPTVGGLILFVLLSSLPIRAAIVEYDLTITREEINITGKPAWGMAINGSIPGPVLRFKEGDTARIHVHNRMQEDSSIHWHGILVPPNMDGVPYLSFPPIEPGATWTYEFPIRQAGTYWYHSHTRLQEQSGHKGGIVIEPRGGERHRADRDYVLVLSDWTDEKPHEVLRTLKRDSDWYEIARGSGQSLLGAARLGMVGDYVKRELLRMPAMDISDVAYDNFLANGRPEISLPAAPGEIVRLRIINGGTASFFYLEFAGGPMTIISADGQDVEPVKEKRFLIAISETYDVLIRVPPGGAYELRATAHDGSGYASVWIGTGERRPAPNVPRPNLYRVMEKVTLKKVFALTPQGAMGMPDRAVKAGKFDRPGMMEMDMPGHIHEKHEMGGPAKHEMEGKKHMPDHPGTHMKKEHEEHEKPAPEPLPQEAMPPRGGKRFAYNFRPLATDVSASKDLAEDGMDPRRPWGPYERLRATRPTAFPKDQPVREIRLTLDGDMDRFVWFINNKPLSETDVIRIKQGEVVRFIMINRTMMHHPMHLHGHFFRVVNEQGDYSPLKHVVDVAPMSTTVIEFDANEFGDWFFHCHVLYHMESGMARVVHYEGYTLDPQLEQVRPKLYHDHWFAWGQVDAISNMTQGFLIASNTRNIFTASWEVGWQKVDSPEWEATFTWDRYVNRFFTLFAGANLVRLEDKGTRGVFGFRYLLPFLIESRVWVDTDGGARFNLGKKLHLTPRLALYANGEYDTHKQWDLRVGMAYLITKNLSLIGQWQHDYGWGGGLRIRF
ncbi:MAG: copper oxidase [Deltaproteobacteria bacterium]|nr:MAG: copper oxidase [Deltaproteobacteria bacterium]